MRCTWLAKLETITRLGAVANTLSIAGVSSRSEVVKPGTSALVESTRNRSTPSSPNRPNARRSVIRSSSGNWSILKSPVCSTSPALVRITTASPSGMEWLTAANSSPNGPAVCVPPASTRTVVGWIRCSLSLDVMNANVSSEPMTGMSDRSRRRYGTPPMWSSCPCVSTIATMSARRCRIEVKSGRITSIPGWVSSGKSTPQSTTSSLPSYSKTVMLRPISPTPPRRVMRIAPRWSTGGAVSFIAWAFCMSVPPGRRAGSPRDRSGRGGDAPAFRRRGRRGRRRGTRVAPPRRARCRRTVRAERRRGGAGPPRRARRRAWRPTRGSSSSRGCS